MCIQCNLTLQVQSKHIKIGGGIRPEGQMRCFREVINKCRLRDLGYMGSDYTWSRRLGSQGWVREILDRALVSTD